MSHQTSPQSVASSQSTPAYAAASSTSPLAPFTISRRAPGPRDIAIEILFCGVCHSDLHTARGEWAGISFPVVPGHEIVGRVAAIGGEVTRHKIGETVAVGCMVDSCHDCSSCQEGLEQYCENIPTFTYNSPDKNQPGSMTLGGYSKRITVDERFVVKVPANLDPAASAPLLCAGITTWSPLRHWRVTKGDRVGIVGLGGLGHMGVKLAAALGAYTVVFTTSAEKHHDARPLGAAEVVNSRDATEMRRVAGSLNFIINTIAAPHKLDDYVALLKRDGTMCLVGAPASPHPSPSIWGLITGRRAIAGSVIGGIHETQEMLNFCGEHNITSDIELIKMDYIETAYERMLKGDVRYRFVIDMATLA